MDCEDQRQARYGDLTPIDKIWYLENKPNSTPGPDLECLVELEQLSNINANNRDDNLTISSSAQMVLNLTVRNL